MRFFSLMIGAVIGLIEAGCVVQSRGPHQPAEPSLMNPYSELKVEVMKRRMVTLKVGMTLEECYAALGLVSGRTMIGDAQESPGRLLLWLYPAEGHEIRILLDTSKTPEALLAMGIDDEVWPALDSIEAKDGPSHVTAPTGGSATPTPPVAHR